VLGSRELELCYVCYSFRVKLCYVLQLFGPVTLDGADYTHLFRWFSPLFCGLYHCRWWCPPCL
jgi:hypothetical protein